MADRPREGDLDGRGQMSQRRYFEFIEFIEFMLDVCHDQVDYMTAAVDPSQLRERVTRSFRYNERLLQQGINPESAAAIIALLTQGSLPLPLSDHQRQQLDELHVDHPLAARLSVLIADELNPAAVHDPEVVRAMVNIMCRRLGQNPSTGGPVLLTQIITWQQQGALSQTSLGVLTMQVKALTGALREP